MELHSSLLDTQFLKRAKDSYVSVLPHPLAKNLDFTRGLVIIFL